MLERYETKKRDKHPVHIYDNMIYIQHIIYIMIQ